MSSHSGPRSFLGGVLSNFWSLPVLATGLSVGLLAALLAADSAGASAWVSAQGWPWSVAGDTVLETASTATAVVVTLASLFFSITLIVLTIAASNLGVRLIDRWVGQVSIRVTLSLLLALLAYAVLLQAAIDPDGPDAELPRLTLAVLLVALVATLGWLAYAFDRLSRLIHVDTSIAGLGEDLARAVAALIAAARPDGVAEPEERPAHTVAARQSGYATAIDLDALERWTVATRGSVWLTASGTRFVAQGDPVARIDVAGHDGDDDTLLSAIDLRRTRREGAGAPFHTAVLAEIAVRALSPALNDIYTALVCVDQLRRGLAPAFASGRLDGRFGSNGRVVAPGLSARGLLEEPLAILRHAAGPLPTMSARLVDALARLAEVAGDARDADWLSESARDTAEQALANAVSDDDRRTIRAALEHVPATLAKSVPPPRP